MGIEFDGSMNIFWYFSVFYLEYGVWSVCGWICFVVLYLLFFWGGWVYLRKVKGFCFGCC